MVASMYNQAGVPCTIIGRVTADPSIAIRVGGEAGVSGTTPALRDAWEETSFALDRRQVGGGCRGLGGLLANTVR
jgi:phosphoribosylformylglycinamidine synthase